MTKGDVSGNSLTGARFSCDSHGKIPFRAGEECPCHTRCVPQHRLLPQVEYFPFPPLNLILVHGWEQQRWEGTGEGTLLLPLGTASSSPPWESAAGNSLVGRSENVSVKGFHRQLLKESPCAKRPQFWRQLALKKRGEKEREKKKKLTHYPKVIFFSSFGVLKPVMLRRWTEISFLLLISKPLPEAAVAIF